MSEADAPGRKRKRRNMGDRVRAEEPFGNNVFLLSCNNPASVPLVESDSRNLYRRVLTQFCNKLL